MGRYSAARGFDCGHASGSLRARILWLGALGLLVYVYGMYALGVRWNELFLVYVALLASRCSR